MILNLIQKPELLSPAGNLEKLKIALAYGADVVYGGVSHFSLRSNASKDFSFSDFEEGITLAHSLNKKVYVTINGFPFNSQINLLKEHIKKMASLNPDAFIIATPGVLSLCKEIASHVPAHISTQANILNVLDAKAFYKLGAKRIVAAREISLKDCIEIKNAIPELEIEIFVHGSMCFAFSGRCLISSLQSGRVPNRGSCANDCRFDYEYYVKNKDNGVLMRLEEEEGVGTHIFNSKDLNLISHLDEILKSNVISALKIEGRTKSSYYAAITTRSYKLAINDFFNNEYKNPSFYQKELLTLKNRGFTDGYLIHRPYQKLDTQNHISAISQGEAQVCAQIDENGEYFLCKFTIRLGQWIEIVFSLDSKIMPIENDIGIIKAVKSQNLNKILKTNILELSDEVNLKEDSKIDFKTTSFIISFKKLENKDGKLFESIHSGNTNKILLPCKLPSFSFLRTII